MYLLCSYICLVCKVNKEVMEAQPPQEEAITSREVKVEKETLEAKIRKARPPPRVRISSTSQPGFVSLRLEGVAVTFRNQEVVKDATWDVKTGDRIGLVGPNGECGDSTIASYFRVVDVSLHKPRSVSQLQSAGMHGEYRTPLGLVQQQTG